MPGAMPKFTKTPPEVAAAFDAAAPSRADIERRTMFSYPALFVRGNMFAFTFGPKIAVRLGEARRERARRAGAVPFEPMPGRPMGEYVEVPAKDRRGAALAGWMADGLAYADTLPEKAKKTTRATGAKKPTASEKPTAARTTKKTVAKKRR